MCALNIHFQLLIMHEIYFAIHRNTTIINLIISILLKLITWEYPNLNQNKASPASVVIYNQVWD